MGVNIGATGETGVFVGASDIITDNLLFHMDTGNDSCYPGTGTTVQDMSGTNSGGTTGTVVGSPTFSIANSSFYFDNADYIKFGNVSNLNFDYDDTYTACTWVYQEDASGMPISKGESSGNYAGWYLYYYAPYKWYYHALTNDTNPQRRWYQYVANINTDVWQYICIQHSWNGSAHSGKFYINGESQTIGATYNTLGTYSPITTKEFCVGSRNLTNLYMDGYVPIVQIYGTALSVYEMRHNFNVDRARFGI
jgi:hypothetical protein